MRYFSLILTFILLHTQAWSQKNPNSSELYEELLSLNVLGTALHVAAHPDDESTGMLTWFARDRHWESNYFAVTRGDGGQNLIGDEQGIPLGLIRTQELIAARKIDGAHQHFSLARDFGFTKSTEEALSVWDKELILSNLVRVIRKLRPDIIFTRFPPDARAGHGHHSASAVLAIEAFKAAADPKRFPEQLKEGLSVWQAKRLLWNTFRFPGSSNSTISNDQFKVQIGNYLSHLGYSTGELASLSRSMHKSQGFGVATDHGIQTEHFVTLDGPAPNKDLADGIDASWNRVEGGAALAKSMNQILAAYNFHHPEASIPALLEWRKNLISIKDSFWKSKKVKALDQWILNAMALSWQATTPSATKSAGEPLDVRVELVLRRSLPLQNLRLRLGNADTLLAGNFPSQEKWVWNKAILVQGPITQPYWLENQPNPGHFVVKNSGKIGQDDVDPALELLLEFDLMGQHFQFQKPIQQLKVDPAKGELFGPFSITPRTSLSLSTPVVWIPTGSSQAKTVQVKVMAMRNLSSGKLEIKTAAGTILASHELKSPLMAGASLEIPVQISPQGLRAGKQGLDLRLHAQVPGLGAWVDSLEMHQIAYDHIPTQRYYSPLRLDVLHMDMQVKGKRIAYIKGAGDKVPEALREMGYQVDFLEAKDLVLSNLKTYDAVMTGVRAHNTQGFLEQAHPVLMQYVAEGGNYVVQYNTSSNIGPMKASMAPYPLRVSRNRITKEDAKPQFLLPQDVIFTYPNKITEKDFEDWVQERSIYHAETNSPNYRYPLGFQDPGENLDAGSLAISDHGKGRFIYTGLVFFRQLPAGVPGAWRLMANLLAKP